MPPRAIAGFLFEQAAAAKAGEQGVEQDRGRYRLDQQTRDAHLFGGADDVLPPVGRHHDHFRLGLDGGIGMDAPDDFVPVHGGHAPVHQDDVEGPHALVLEHAHGTGAIGGDGRLQAEEAQHLGQDFTGHFVVVHDQHANVLEQRPCLLDQLAGSVRASRATRKRTVQHTVVPLPGEDSSIHRRPPISSARCLLMASPGRCRQSGGWWSVGLGELLEQALHHFGRHADAGVAHGEVQHHFVLGARQAVESELDLALLGELDGVAAQVEHDLARRRGSPTRTGGSHIVADQEFDALLFGQQADGSLSCSSTLSRPNSMARSPACRPRSSRSRGCR
jgi:hypothetical protein